MMFSAYRYVSLRCLYTILTLPRVFDILFPIIVSNKKNFHEFDDIEHGCNLGVKLADNFLRKRCWEDIIRCEDTLEVGDDYQLTEYDVPCLLSDI